jgi:hypothetical protein
MKFKFLIGFLALLISSISLMAVDTYKIEDLYAKNTMLDGKIISVKGKVVKISSAIMGKDWIHVQDDSKTPKKNKVIFTSKIGSANVTIGDTVTAKGTLKAKVDIGAGYFYDVLVEDSTFTK